MKKADSIVLKVFLYGLPIAIILAIFCSLVDPDPNARPTLIQSIYNLSGLVFGIWMAFSFYLSGRLVFSKYFRSKILTTITFYQERDEREAMLSGMATKHSFLMTLSILILFLCLSVFRVSIDRLPPDKAIDGKTGAISLDVSLNMLNEAESLQKQHVVHSYFNYPGLPLSNTAIILFLILWQIISYNYFIKKVSKFPEVKVLSESL